MVTSYVSTTTRFYVVFMTITRIARETSDQTGTNVSSKILAKRVTPTIVLGKHEIYISKKQYKRCLCLFLSVFRVY